MTADVSSKPAVLLVDDSELACESVKHTLGTAGIQVVALNSPFGFIKAIREHKPRLILLDVGLGSVSGTKLVHLGRQHAPMGCPILLYSGRTTLPEDTAASEADGYIEKSTTGQDLVATVSRWLGLGPPSIH
jgi:DNA-binding response OmpR family regulator